MCKRQRIATGLLPVVVFAIWVGAAEADGKAPYPPSALIARIVWHWETRRSAAPGSDLWPVTWAADDGLYAAFGDGGGFNGTDQDGRVACGFARIDGPPENFSGVNLNGGKEGKHPASYPKRGKVGGLLAVENRIYGWLNLQNGKWPDVDQALIWSDDSGATWRQSEWVFPKGEGRFKPATFLNFGRGYTGIPKSVGEFVYFYGPKQGNAHDQFIGRAPIGKVEDKNRFEYLCESDPPGWSLEIGKAISIFSDSRPSHDTATIVYVPALKRYLLSTFHKGPGELGVFDSANPWGPWTTVAYEDRWGEMGHEGDGLGCSFPAKWMSEDGLSLWCVFSAYGKGAKEGIDGHDKFNVVKATVELKGKP